jgi:hypothetical protein
VSDIESALAEKKIHAMLNVKNCKLFEGVSPSFCNLVKHFMNPKNAHRANKNGLFTKPSMIIKKRIDFFHEFLPNKSTKLIKLIKPTKLIKPIKQI